MRVVILHNRLDCAQALAGLILRDVPTLDAGEIRILPDDSINNSYLVLDFLERNKDSVRVIILDVHSRVNPSDQSDRHAGLRIYQRMIERELFDMAIITTSFEPLNSLKTDTEFEKYFQPEWLKVNPFIQFPALRDEIGLLIKGYL